MCQNDKKNQNETFFCNICVADALKCAFELRLGTMPKNAINTEDWDLN